MALPPGGVILEVVPPSSSTGMDHDVVYGRCDDDSDATGQARGRSTRSKVKDATRTRDTHVTPRVIYEREKPGHR